MGSGSFGGSGSGGSGGGGGSGVGGYRSEGGKMVSSAPSLSKVEKEVTKIRGKLPKDYVLRMFCSPMIRAVYEFLFEVAVHVFQNRSWKGLDDRFGVPVGPGMSRWITAVLANYDAGEGDQKVIANARLALEDFFLAALNNDTDLFNSGTAERILSALDKKIFESTSGYFLGFLLWRVIDGELEAPAATTEHHLLTITQKLADRIIHSFESKFYAKGQTTYRDLFEIVQENPEWFCDLLRK
jgi:hypothetical protein